jgi:hypothetical protein
MSRNLWLWPRKFFAKNEGTCVIVVQIKKRKAKSGKAETDFCNWLRQLQMDTDVGCREALGKRRGGGVLDGAGFGRSRLWEILPIKQKKP